MSTRYFLSSIWLIILGLLEACPKTSVPPTAQNIWPIFVQKIFFFWSIFLMRISAALKFLRSVSKRKQKRVQNRPCRRDRDVFLLIFIMDVQISCVFFVIFFLQGPCEGAFGAKSTKRNYRMIGWFSKLSKSELPNDRWFWNPRTFFQITTAQSRNLFFFFARGRHGVFFWKTFFR